LILNQNDQFFQVALENHGDKFNFQKILIGPSQMKTSVLIKFLINIHGMFSALPNLSRSMNEHLSSWHLKGKKS
jgi:hypothetical protein